MIVRKEKSDQVGDDQIAPACQFFSCWVDRADIGLTYLQKKLPDAASVRRG